MRKCHLHNNIIIYIMLYIRIAICVYIINEVTMATHWYISLIIRDSTKSLQCFDLLGDIVTHYKYTPTQYGMWI